MFANTKKFVVAGLAAVTVAGAALAFANTLTVTSDDLGSGAGGVGQPACAPDAAYTTTWDAAAKEFEVTTVTLTAVGCEGDNVQVAIVDDAGATLWNSGVAAQFDSVTGVKTFTVADGVDSADVFDIYVTVNGAAPAA